MAEPEQLFDYVPLAKFARDQLKRMETTVAQDDFRPWRIAVLIVCSAFASLLAGCGGSDTDPATGIHSAQTAKCVPLNSSTLPASAIGLPSRGAVVTSATLEPASTEKGTPEFCKVLGSISALNPVDPPINFEVNMPTAWNMKALQYGGGGLNGTVITGLTQYAHGPAGGAPTPLAQGYVTFGGDSGHQASPLDGTFGMNTQALANYSGESVKRTHDAAATLIQNYYGRSPRRMYHIGGSKGGHESLVAAQRYAADYDGVVAYYPAGQNPLLVLSWFRMWKAAYGTPGGDLSTAKQQLLKSKALAACDKLDGAEDEIISNTSACRSSFKLQSLRCPSGADEGDSCLSDTQLATLRTADSPMQLDYPMANGYTSVGPYPVLFASDLAGNLFDNLAFPIPLGHGKANGFFYLPDPVIRMWYMQDPASSFADFDYRQYQPRIQQFSQAYDSSSPDLDRFKARAGKLILVQGTNDMQVPEGATTAYYQSLVKRYTGATNDFVRYYVQPGFGHSSGEFLLTWDSLSALDRWVETGTPPVNPVATDANSKTAGRTRPICEYPLFPRFNGTGSLATAANFTCSAS